MQYSTSYSLHPPLAKNQLLVHIFFEKRLNFVDFKFLTNVNLNNKYLLSILIPDLARYPALVEVGLGTNQWESEEPVKLLIFPSPVPLSCLLW